MARTTLSVNLHVEGSRELLAAFRRLPKDASAALRDASLELATALADRAAVAAAADAAPQSKLLVPTIRAKRDRVPAVQVGGSTRVGRNKVPAYKVLFGAEFGSNQHRQFGRVHSGRRGYWFFPLVEEQREQIETGWLKAADDIVSSFTRGGVI